MLRPIDTQILYPQSPELSGRQQMANQQANLQQNQFADIMQKQTQEKKERVNKAPEKQKIDNELNKNKQSNNKEYQNKKRDGSKQEAEKESSKPQAQGNAVKIDIKV